MSGWASLGAAAVSAAATVYGSNQAKKASGGKVRPIDIFAPARKGIYKGTSRAQRSATGFTDYLTKYGPGLSELSRKTMQSISPEQARFIRGLEGLYEQQKGDIAAFSRRAEEERNRYGLLAPTLKDISGFTQVQTPENQAQMAQTMAEEAFARRGQLSPEEQRMAQQQAREASAASGRIGGNAAVASEIMNREAAMAARRGEAATLGQSALQQQLSTQQARYAQLSAEQERELARRQNLFAQDVNMREFGLRQLLGLEGMQSDLGQRAAATGTAAFNAAGQFYTTPGLSMLSMPINLASQSAANAQGAQGANAQIAASNYAAQMGMIGNIAGAGMQALGSYYQGGGAGGGAGGG